ncbi:MAG: M28 family peptidase [Gemmatimonadota bacterium]
MTDLQTRAEGTGFRETTPYDEVVRFSREVSLAHPMVHLTTFGYTTEGRPLPLLVVGEVEDASPEAVRASGKTRVYVQGGIHAGEISGKEALLILLREFSQGDHALWTDSLVLLVAPLFNADGNENVDLRNRRRQHGPVGGMGTRANAEGLDLNRDQMKLDAPESRSLVKLYTDYDPHLSVDLHTTNGTRHGYHLTYSPPLNPNTPAEVDELLRGRWLPEVTRRVKEKHGWDMYYYGNAYQPRGATDSGWYTFDSRGRYVSNYIGLRNRFGILGEAYSYATFHDRTRISQWFVEEILNFAHENASEIRKRTAQADARSLVGDSLSLRATLQRSAEPVTILMGRVLEDRNPYTGEVMLRRTDAQLPEEMYEFGTFRPTEWERVPEAYYIPPELQDVQELVLAHGIRHVILETAVEAQVQEFVVDSLSTSTREYEGHREQEVRGGYRDVLRTLDPGTMRVPMAQPLARVAFALLEPRSDDGLLAWGLLAGSLAEGAAYPVLRALPGVPQAPAPGVQEAVASITEADFYNKVEIIAHDSMLGRYTPSPGLDMTARWVAGEFRRLGLKPGGDDGTYIQEYVIEEVGTDNEGSSFTVSGVGSLEFGEDVVVGFSAPSGEELTGGVTILSGGDLPPGAPLEAIRGRHVLVLPPEGPEAQGRRAQMRLLGGVLAQNPLSIILASSMGDAEWDELLQAQRPATRTPWQEQGPARFPTVLTVRRGSLERLLGPHGITLPSPTGEPEGPGVLTPLSGLELAIQARSRVVSRLRAPNTVGILEGSDPALKGEYLVYSGHMDHIGVRAPDASGDSIANGADDDASGTVAVVELAEAFAMMDPAPKRSIIFLAVSGEERGLWGSSYFSAFPPVPVEDMVANLNADMISRNWSDTIVVIGKEHSELGEMVEEVAARHPELGMAPIDDIWPEENFYGRSDHFNFARKGVPVLFFFNGPHEDYHRVTDEVERIDAEKAARITRLMFYLGLEVANLPDRPKWDPRSYADIVQSGGG